MQEFVIYIIEKIYINLEDSFLFFMQTVSSAFIKQSNLEINISNSFHYSSHIVVFIT